MPNYWTIQNDPPPNPGAGNALNGLQIQQLSPGPGYELLSGSSQLQSTTDTTFPINFNGVRFANRVWNISATSLPVGADGAGSWARVTPQPEETGDNGEFTAQAGTGMEEPGASSSAYA